MGSQVALAPNFPRSIRPASGRLRREPRNEEVHPYWVETIEINLDSLRSGDPDLIYPGEELMLPKLMQLGASD